MTDPLVACIMLTKDRPEMAKRAVESFRRQTYQNKRLVVVDNVAEPNRPAGIEEYYAAPPSKFGTIGSLRNLANKWSGCNILIHWDDDDWSHPNRITEQVALLQASGKQCVGYRDMLFWREPRKVPLIGLDTGIGFAHNFSDGETDGEAWLYTNQDPRYCLGTSLAYFRSAWEANPFKDISRGEDKEFIRNLDSLGVSSIVDNEPRLIASIHAGNHVPYETTGTNWSRVPLWDEKLRSIMSL